MSAKPFGKPVGSGRPITRGLRLAIALLLAGIPAYFLCGLGSPRYPTLADSPFFWPAAVGFVLFYLAVIVLWLRHRPSPHGPWESGCIPVGMGRLLGALAIAAPAGLASAYLYEPAFEVANGTFTLGRATTMHAMVSETSPRPVLNLLYASPPFRWKIPGEKFAPPDLIPGSLATITVRPGLLGALWVENVDYEILR